MAEEPEDTKNKYKKTQNVEKVFVNATTSLHLENPAFTSEPSTGQRILENPPKRKSAEDLCDPAFELKKKKEENDDAPKELKATTSDAGESNILTNSSTEIEQNLCNKDVQCTICHGADVWVGNPLLKCLNCHSVYHELCHYPRLLYDADDEWICHNCKVASVLSTESTPNPTPSNVGKFPFPKLPHPSWYYLFSSDTSSDLKESNPKHTCDPPKRIRSNLTESNPNHTRDPPKRIRSNVKTSTPIPASSHAAKPPFK